MDSMRLADLIVSTFYPGIIVLFGISITILLSKPYEAGVEHFVNVILTYFIITSLGFFFCISLSPNQTVPHKGTDLSLTMAWKLWWQGEDLVNFLWQGETIRAWGRRGKLFEIYGAGMLILEYFGITELQARISQLIGTYRFFYRKAPRLVLLMVFCLIPIAVSNHLVSGAIVLIALLRLANDGIEHPMGSRIGKLIAGIILIAGIHFELLAS